RTEERARSVALGRELLDREARKYRLSPATMLESEELRKLGVEHGYTTVDDLLAGLGYGKLAPSTIVARFLPPDATEEVRTESKPAKPTTRPRTDAGGVTVKGVDDVLTRFAKCCGPVPGDPIVGFITRGRGMTVHAQDCPNLAGGVVDNERTVAVEWAEAEQRALPVKIAVHIGRDRPGLLADISTAISSRQANIVKAEVTVTEDRKGLNHFTVEVKDLEQLKGVMAAISAIKDVIDVERVRGL
ncbi:MAG TPA: ACT domain-containing protein, partial [Myxococcaceae bacterium]